MAAAKVSSQNGSAARVAHAPTVRIGKQRILHVPTIAGEYPSMHLDVDGGSAVEFLVDPGSDVTIVRADALVSLSSTLLPADQPGDPSCVLQGDGSTRMPILGMAN